MSTAPPRNRDKYEVRLTAHPDAREIVFIRHADNPAHAIAKAKRALGEGYTITKTVVRKIDQSNTEDSSNV